MLTNNPDIRRPPSSPAWKSAVKLPTSRIVRILRTICQVFCCSLVLLSATASAGESLRILSWPGYASPEAVRAFELRHGVSVELTVVNSDDELWDRARKDSGGSFDLIALNTAELQRYIDADLVGPIRIKNIPNTRNQLQRFTRLSSIPGIMRDGEPYGVPYTYSAMGLIYNKQLVSQAPNSMAAMWEPRYKGKVLAYNGSAHNFSLTALTLGYRDPFKLTTEQFNQVVNRLRGLRDNILKFYSSPDEVVQLFKEREVALIFANYGDQQIQELKRAGADIGYIIPREGALAWLDCWAVARRARDRALAEAWINHVLAPGVARQLTDEQGLSNTLKDSAENDSRRSDKLIWLEPVEDAQKRAIFWERILAGTVPRARAK